MSMRGHGRRNRHCQGLFIDNGLKLGYFFDENRRIKIDTGMRFDTIISWFCSMSELKTYSSGSAES